MIICPFFPDSNVPIGFTIIHDKWHISSQKFINEHKNSLLWSNLVEDEYNNKFEDIVDESDQFLKKTSDLLQSNQKDFINYSEFEKFIIIKTKSLSLDEIKKKYFRGVLE